MRTYYYEWADGFNGPVHYRDFESDTKAEAYASQCGADVCYRENDTKDGRPFVIVCERQIPPVPTS